MPDVVRTSVTSSVVSGSNAKVHSGPDSSQVVQP